MNVIREEARNALHVYMCRSGLSLSQLAERMGYSPYSLRQLSSIARYGDSQGQVAGHVVLEWLKKHPLAAPGLPGKLYRTRATDQMDALLAHIRQGGWGVLYGPSGSGKSFLLEYRGAENARDGEPSIIYVRTSPSGMTPNVLLDRIAAALGAPYAQATDAVRQSVLYAVRQRRTSLALVLDEADTLYKWVETLETLRELGDLLRAGPGRAGVGILVAGNERVMQIFENRRGVYFEKWRGRIEQEGLRVIGPSAEEAAGIMRGELGELKPATVETVVEGCLVDDPVSHKRYVNAHRLFNAIGKFKERRGSKTN
jgi:type II secretory pathway predicted ATPase ExeA